MVERDGNIERSCGAGVEFEQSSGYWLKEGGVGGGVSHVFMFQLSAEDVTMERAGWIQPLDQFQRAPSRNTHTDKRVQKSGHLSGELYSIRFRYKQTTIHAAQPPVYVYLSRCFLGNSLVRKPDA